MVRIRRFGVIRTANVVALLYVVIVAIVVLPIALIVLVAAPGSTEWRVWAGWGSSRSVP